jgi:hypothetical protein
MGHKTHKYHHYYALVVGELMGPDWPTHEKACNWARDRIAAWRKPVRVEVYIQVGEKKTLLDVMETTTVGVAKYYAIGPTDGMESDTFRGALNWARAHAKGVPSVEVFVRIHGEDTLLETIRPE